MGYFGNFFRLGGGVGAPTAKTASAPASAGVAYTITRLLGPSSTLSLLAASNSNLTLSGNQISQGKAITIGNSQTAVVREVSGSLAVEYPVTLNGTAPAPVTSIVSASHVTSPPTTQSSAFTYPVNYCTWHKTAKRGSQMTTEFWNGYVAASVGSSYQEKACDNANTIRRSIVYGVTQTNKFAADQSTGSLESCLWTKAYAGTAGYVWKLDGTTPTSSDLSAAISAGTLALADSNRQITVPPGWRVRSDETVNVALGAGEWYRVQDEYALVGSSFKIPVSGQTYQATTGSSRVLNSTAYVLAKVWANGTLSGPLGAPCDIWIVNPDAAKMVTVEGDSIFAGNQDSLFGASAITGDADGCLSPAQRALNLAGYSFNRSAVAGTAATNTTSAGDYVQRALSARYSSAVISDMGHNNRGLAWAGAAGTGLLATMRAHWSKLRASTLGGTGRIVATTLLPQATSTDSFATTANQTSTTGPGSPQYDSYNPFIRAGSFTVASGDPDAGYDMNAAFFAAAPNISVTVSGTAYAFSDIDTNKTKFPASGQAASANNAATPEGTHSKAPFYAAIAADLQQKLSVLLGF